MSTTTVVYGCNQKIFLMKIVGLFLLLFCTLSVNAQIETLPFLNSGVDQIPENYGGKEELKRMLDFHMQYPEKALKDKVEGTVDIKYICSKEGQIETYSIVNSPDKLLEPEATRLFRMLLFQPAIKEDDSVAYEHYISIPFSVSKYKKALKRRDKTNINPEQLPEDSSGVIYRKAEKQPYYVYGTDSLINYIYSELEYPQEAKLNNLEGTVVLSFIVEPNGFVSNLKVEKSLAGGCQEEAIRVVGATKWIPAQANKKRVRYRMTYSVVFKLNNVFKDNSHGTQRIGGY